MDNDIDIRSLVLEAYKMLDLYDEDVHPDPIEWDGRPLDEQARDLCALLDAEAQAARDRMDFDVAAKLEALSDSLWAAAQAMAGDA